MPNITINIFRIDGSLRSGLCSRASKIERQFYLFQVLILPLAVSIALYVFPRARIKRFACIGVKMILDFTLLLGVPGITFTKSTTNSAWLCDDSEICITSFCHFFW